MERPSAAVNGGIETMSAQEGREWGDDIRQLMACWDATVALAESELGLPRSRAEDLVGRYFTRKFQKEG